MRIWREIGILVVLTVIFAANGRDLIHDLSHGATLYHLIEEALVSTVTFAAAVWLVRRLWLQRRELETLRCELELAGTGRPPSDKVMQARRHLGDAIQEQFQVWGLTASEREVGLLLLKGLSLKEIAALRKTTEKTVRQQASSIYQKAGLPGRHAFAAWFFEDLM